MSKYYIGIDLGTTNSTVSVIKLDASYENPTEKLRTCPIYQYGERITDGMQEDVCLPSALYFDIENKHVYTGNYAKGMYASGDFPLQTVRSIKTRMGLDSRLEIPGLRDSSKKEIFSMPQCASFFIRTIVSSLKQQYPEAGDSITDNVVVTVPAAFNDDERVATRNAVLLGGFKNCTILDEPTAALLSYLNSDSDDFSSFDMDDEATYKLVYDIGGGTLDVAIAKVEMDEDGNYTVNIVSLSDRMNLGGDNFDRLLGAYFLSDFENTNSRIEERSLEDQGRIIARIVSNAEDYKINLSDKILSCDNERRKAREHVNVTFELIDRMYVEDIVLYKKDLDEIYQRYISPNAVKDGLLTPIKTALRRAGLKKEDINEVILTGGMSNFYAVHELMNQFFDDVPLQMVDDTRTAVSRGAALYAWGLDEDNEPEDESVKRINKISPKLGSNIYIKINGKFEPLILNDMEKRSGTFQYPIEDETVAFFPLYLYSGSEPENGEDNTDTYIQLAGRMIESGPQYKKGDKIPLKWSIDDNKVITIEIEGRADIKLTKLLSNQEVANDPVQKYCVNRE